MHVEYCSEDINRTSSTVIFEDNDLKYFYLHHYSPCILSLWLILQIPSFQNLHFFTGLREVYFRNLRLIIVSFCLLNIRKFNHTPLMSIFSFFSCALILLISSRGWLLIFISDLLFLSFWLSNRCSRWWLLLKRCRVVRYGGGVFCVVGWDGW